MSLILIGAYGWSGGPYFAGFWMIPMHRVFRVSFDPSFHSNGYSFSIGYQKGFSLMNQVFAGFGYKGINLLAENMYVNLPEEDEYSGRYNEFSLTAGYSIIMVDALNIGLSISYYQIEVPRRDIPTLSTFGLNIGARFKIYEFWKVGIFSKNINLPELGGLTMPTSIGGYISFSPKADITTSFGAIKDQYGSVNFGFGGIWRIFEVLNIIASLRYDGNVPSYYAGVSVGVKKMSADIITNIHPDLPLSYFFGLNY